MKNIYGLLSDIGLLFFIIIYVLSIPFLLLAELLALVFWTLDKMLGRVPVIGWVTGKGKDLSNKILSLIESKMQKVFR